MRSEAAAQRLRPKGDPSTRRRPFSALPPRTWSAGPPTTAYRSSGPRAFRRTRSKQCAPTSRLDDAQRAAFRAATFRAYWGEDRDIAEDGVLKELLAEAGADADAVLARAQTPEVKQALVTATQRAADVGVFGAPTWVVNGEELFWGQDRIPLVERALVR